MDIQQSIISWAKAHEEEFYQDLAALIAIDSAKGEALPGMPYGKGCALVLEKAEEILNKAGFSAVNHDNYVLTSDLNDQETELGILAHLDIVPTGDGWSFPPLEMRQDAEKVYGRGTEKGLTGQCLHARELKFIHPRTGESVHLTTELPEYFLSVLGKLGPPEG